MSNDTTSLPVPLPRLVAYYRVSTQKQGESGLGLEAQVADVEKYARSNNADVLQSYREIESGRKSERTEIHRAIAHARRAHATLVIAKLDRLSRSVTFTSNLMDTRVPFVCCDMPFATELTIHILVAVAQDEAKRISARTKAALAAYRARAFAPVPLDQSVMLSARKAPYVARGWVLGAKIPECRNLTAETMAKGRIRSAQVRAEKAARRAADVLPVAEALRAEGKSLLAIADALNAEGAVTTRGKPWGPMQVLRVLNSAEKADAATAARIAATQAARDEARARREAAAKARWEALQARRGGLTGAPEPPQ